MCRHRRRGTQCMPGGGGYNERDRLEVTEERTQYSRCRTLAVLYSASRSHDRHGIKLPNGLCFFFRFPA